VYAPAPMALPEEDGYRLWLRHARLEAGALAALGDAFDEVSVPAAGLELASAELVAGLVGLLGRPVAARLGPPVRSGVCLATHAQVDALAPFVMRTELDALGDEGFLLRRVTHDGRRLTLIVAAREVGVLYGVFELLRRLTLATLPETELVSVPRVKLRVLDHWDNLDGSVERGYAGRSLWDWHKLPHYVDPRYTDYARANASTGINAVALTNVNANALVLTPHYLAKVRALADVFRPYGIRVFLTARFSAPVELAGLSTADPLDAGVRSFWRDKVREIYEYVPDFGGFLVKANSEGQPGPQDYGRTHADGANLLSEALAPYGGHVFWRAFVYSNEVPEDRAKQAYDEFQPLDGLFRDNVVVQVKNGPVDFQPREPHHPLFGAMPKTPLAIEFQLTQEYLGCATHLVYLAPLFEECLKTDTFARGAGSEVFRVVDGSLHESRLSAMAAVSNIGSDRNWCGHPFAQANWYAYGRMAWDPERSAAELAEEWLGQTFTREPRFVNAAKSLMLESREACVSYMTPLGLLHLMAWDHHYGPGPWIAEGRRDWTSVYFHRADADGIGFDRSPSGSNAVSQYFPPLSERYGALDTCPEPLLLFFHHVRWNHRLASGRTLWDELCHRYSSGVRAVESFRARWDALGEFVDGARFRHVAALLTVQEREARWWRDACLLYFQTFSKREIPPELERPRGTLSEYRAIRHYFVPGI
jgi:alpha-glucuronidase